MIRKKRIALIGLGKQTQQEFIPSLQLLSKSISVVAICDPNLQAIQAVQKIYPDARGYQKDQEFFTHETKLDAVLLCVPHYLYYRLTKKALSRHIPVLKEKPLSLNLSQARKLCSLSKHTHTPLYTITKRSMYPSYIRGKKVIEQLGIVYQFHAHHTISCGNLYEGWRSQEKTAGGGVFMDLGYHLMDIILRYFGKPADVVMRKSNLGKEGYSYSVEDAATLLFTYKSGLHGSFSVNCLSALKDEYIQVWGTRGTVIIRKNSVTVYRTDGTEKKQLLFPTDAIKITKEIISNFLSNPKTDIEQNQSHHLQMMSVIQKAYASKKR